VGLAGVGDPCGNPASVTLPEPLPITLPMGGPYGPVRILDPRNPCRCWRPGVRSPGRRPSAPDLRRSGCGLDGTSAGAPADGRAASVDGRARGHRGRIRRVATASRSGRKTVRSNSPRTAGSTAPDRRSARSEHLGVGLFRRAAGDDLGAHLHRLDRAGGAGLEDDGDDQEEDRQVPELVEPIMIRAIRRVRTAANR